MPDSRTHLEVPPEAVRTDAVRHTGFSVPYVRPSYAEHGEALVAQVRSLRATLAAARDSTDSETLFVRVSTPAGVSIRAEKTRLRSSGLEVVTLSDRSDNVATAKIGRDQFGELEGRILRYATEAANPFRSYLSILDDIVAVPASEKLDPRLLTDDATKFRATIQVFAGLRERERAAVLVSIRNRLTEMGASAVRADGFLNGEAAVSANATPSMLRTVAQDYVSVKRIAPSQLYYIADATPVRPIPPNVTVARPASSVVVAVVDSGINDRCSVMTGCVTGKYLAVPPGTVADEQHGTFVASRILYGDDIESSFRAGTVTPACRVFDVPVFGRDAGGAFVALDEQELAKAIESGVAASPPETRVVNLSLGTNAPILDNEFSLVARVLDNIARMRDLIVVTTAGNVRDERLRAAFPGSLALEEYRIDSPGEALLALTTGSIAKFGDGSTISQSMQMSAFSRRGPGADSGAKPELVAHGGNCLLSGATHTRWSVQGLHGSGTSIAADSGTSHAAPLVAQAAARLCAYYGNPPANLVRALLVHFAESARPIASPVPVEYLTGYGEPNVHRGCQAGNHSVAFLYSGHIDRDNYKYIPFLVPPALASTGTGSLRIRVTVAQDPPVNANNYKEYCKARISVLVRKRIAVGFRDVSVGDVAPGDARWAPILRFDKSFARAYATGDWEIRLRLFTRDLPDDHQQAYSAVIEVIDDSGTVDVLSNVLASGGSRYRSIVAGAAA